MKEAIERKLESRGHSNPSKGAEVIKMQNPSANTELLSSIEDVIVESIRFHESINRGTFTAEDFEQDFVNSSGLSEDQARRQFKEYSTKAIKFLKAANQKIKSNQNPYRELGVAAWYIDEVLDESGGFQSFLQQELGRMSGFDNASAEISRNYRAA